MTGNVGVVVDDPLALAALRRLSRAPLPSQRALARELGVSVGKTHYVLRALLAKGLVKMENVRSSQNRAAYLYVLTPQGVAAKAALTRRFLARKVQEWEQLRAEIEELSQEEGL